MSAPETLTLSTPSPSAPRLSEPEHRRLAGRVKLLSWLSLGWMSVEGGVAILAGVLAGSVALIGFGLDSVIEGLASGIIIWRFTGDRLSATVPSAARRSSSRPSFSYSRPTSASSRSRR